MSKANKDELQARCNRLVEELVLLAEAAKQMSDTVWTTGGVPTDEITSAILKLSEAERRARGALSKKSFLPTCPHCKAEMRPIDYHGYYDQFNCWECDRENIPGAVKEKGGYV